MTQDDTVMNSEDFSPFNYPNNSGYSSEWQTGRPQAARARRVPGLLSTRSMAFTLEDNDDRTANSMGLSAEQDTGLLVALRSVIRDEVDGVSADVLQVYGNQRGQTKSPVYSNLLHDEFQPDDNVAKSHTSESIEKMAAPHGPALVRLFSKHVHPVYCVVAKVRFLRAYSTDRLQKPGFLRGAVYGWRDVLAVRSRSGKRVAI